jgi:hypothetical protein
MIGSPLTSNRYLAPSVAFAVSFVFLLLAMDRQIGMFDEGIVLSDAMRVNAAELIHRDFYSSYGPGSYVSIALLFKLFKAQFLVARIFGICVMAGVVATVAYLLVRSVGAALIALAVACSLIWINSVASYLYPLFPSLLLALLATAALVSDDIPARGLRLVIVGMCTGLIAYFRYDVAAFTLISDAVAIACLLLLDRRAGGAKIWVRSTSTVALWALVAFAPGAIYFLSVSSSSFFMADIVEYGVEYYARMRGLPFPLRYDLLHYPQRFVIYVPPIALLFALLEMRRLGYRTPPALADRRWLYVLVASSTLTASMYLKGLARVHEVHMIASIVAAFVVIVVCIHRWWTSGRLRPRTAAAIALCTLIIPTGFAVLSTARIICNEPTRFFAGWVATIATGKQTRTPCAQPVRQWSALVDPHVLAVARFVELHSLPNERILVALTQHDRVFVNPVALYFLADRLPSTHWHQFDPGLQTRADVQSGMVRELEDAQVRWVVRDSLFIEEPNNSRLSSGVRALDDYLGTHFHNVAESGTSTIWLRNGASMALSGDATDGDKQCMATLGYPDQR